VNPRTEPLLWIQLLGLAVLPLEALLLLLVLGGSDPGPVPLVEELLCWSLGAVAPALLLWRMPADVWSVLLAQIPIRGRRDLQQRLSRLQEALPLKLLGPALGAVALLPLLIRLDQQAALAAPLWRQGHLPRPLALLLAALLLALMLWQWQQIIQALWLLSRPLPAVEATPPMGLEEHRDARLSLGVPLLLPSPLLFPAPAAPPRPISAPPHAAPSTPAADVPSASSPIDDAGVAHCGEDDVIDAVTDSPSAVDGSPLPVEPEQPAADEEGTHLDEPIA
jgi:hypothetical protein